MKVYNKKGIHNYKEKKLEAALNAYFEKNPDAANGYEMPQDYDSLKATHDKYCIETAEIISETESTHEEFRKGMEETVVKDEEDLFTPSETPREDPMNRDQPIIRPYVHNDGFKDEVKQPEQNSSFAEPTSFRESFDLPDDSIQSEKKAAPTSQEPINGQPRPKQAHAVADPDAKIKNKSRKKFTKYAVDGICALSGKLLVWYTTKDITEDSLKNYVASGEISEEALNFIAHIDATTQGTIRQFFQNRIGIAQELAYYTPEEKEDLIDALNDFLEFKKIEINPTINLITVFLGMQAQRAVNAFTLKVETNSILQQLKDHTAQQPKEEQADEIVEPEPVKEPEQETKE